MAARRQRTRSPRVEFPLLEANGLYASKIKGDGNCLFNALSDQMYGHQGEHLALRDATIAHMRANSDFYRQYMAVNNVRRNPKRKATAPATCIDTTYHSEEELQRLFDVHVQKMGQPGEWADNMEVSAFASAMNVHVRLWQADYSYVFSPQVYYSDDVEDDRATLNIAYHTWEHYSSVRNSAGPHAGLPGVTANPTITSRKRSSVERDDYDEPVSRASKRRSPLPLFDSDSTPESSESSSDESNPSSISSQSQAVETLEPAQPHPKLTIKLRNTKLSVPSTDAATEPATRPTTERNILRLPLCRPVTPTTETITSPQVIIDLTSDGTTEKPSTEATTETTTTI